jgi:electron transfer flavoprotein beta subunit
MNVVVCFKQVPDTETKIQINQGKDGISEEGVKSVINPYDEYAIEEGLRIKEKFGGEVTMLCLGPERVTESIRTALAMGADKAVHLCDPAFEKLDSYSTAKVLSMALKNIPFDIILTGKQGVDYDNSQVFSILAEMLNIPQVSVVVGLEISDDKTKAVAKREIEAGGIEIVETSLPVIIAAQKGLNEPRYASLPGIMKAKKKEITRSTLAHLGISTDELRNKVKLMNFGFPPPREAGKIIQGEVVEVVVELAKILHQEEKII